MYYSYVMGIGNEIEELKDKADKDCGSCGCELDPLYKRALELI